MSTSDSDENVLVGYGLLCREFVPIIIGPYIILDFKFYCELIERESHNVVYDKAPMLQHKVRTTCPLSKC